MLFLGAGIAVVIGITFMAYSYFVKDAPDSSQVVKVESAEGVGPAGDDGKSALSKEAREVQDALNIFAAIANVPLDTEFFNDAKFKSLTEQEVVIPSASPIPGRVFMLWNSPQASAKQVVAPANTSRR